MAKSNSRPRPLREGKGKEAKAESTGGLVEHEMRVECGVESGVEYAVESGANSTDPLERTPVGVEFNARFNTHFNSQRDAGRLLGETWPRRQFETNLPGAHATGGCPHAARDKSRMVRRWRILPLLRRPGRLSLATAAEKLIGRRPDVSRRRPMSTSGNLAR